MSYSIEYGGDLHRLLAMIFDKLDTDGPWYVEVELFGGAKVKGDVSRFTPPPLSDTDGSGQVYVGNTRIDVSNVVKLVIP